MNGNVLRTLREEKGMTQEQMAELVGKTPRAYVSWERSERDPSSEQICFLASFFGVSTDFLLGRASERNKPAQTQQYNEKIQRLADMLAAMPEDAADNAIAMMENMLQLVAKK